VFLLWSVVVCRVVYVAFNSKFSNHNINKSHVKITSCYFLAVEIAFNPSFRETEIWHRTMQLIS